jgi:hypothetical protein
LTDRLDESKLDQLRAWGSGLSAHERADVRATGKAILMLIEEIERLHIDLWNAQSPPDQLPLEGGDSSEQAREFAGELAPESSLGKTLRARLTRVRSQ